MDPTVQRETMRLEAWITNNYATASRTACLTPDDRAVGPEARR